MGVAAQYVLPSLTSLHEQRAMVECLPVCRMFAACAPAYLLASRVTSACRPPLTSKTMVSPGCTVARSLIVALRGFLARWTPLVEARAVVRSGGRRRPGAWPGSAARLGRRPPAPATPSDGVHQARLRAAQHHHPAQAGHSRPSLPSRLDTNKGRGDEDKEERVNSWG